MSKTQPAFKVLTWGCQMNEDDSHQMGNLLRQMGYRPASDESDADVIMLNTCSVREKPEQKVRSKLGELRLLKEQKPDLIIGLCGCMAQREGLEFVRRTTYVDMVIGTGGISEIPSLIRRIRAGERPVYALDLPKRNGRVEPAVPCRVIGEVSLKQFVPVMYGCDNYCAYCVVPYARGPERSRPIDDIVDEVTELASRGCREVTLIGQNVNSYGRTIGHGVDFACLLDKLNDVPGLERIRFTTSHPKDLSERLMDALADLPKVCEHLHLPIQAGDNNVLRAMRRGYTVEHYLDLVERLRDRLPGIALTTDVMVGFPGETEEQFRNTLRTIQRIRFDAAFMFVFNPRPGTTAARMDNQVDSATRKRRLSELIPLQNRITLEINKSQVGRQFEVLVEGPSEKDSSKLTGSTRTHKTINFPGGPGLTGSIVMVRAVSAHPWGFTGELTERGRSTTPSSRDGKCGRSTTESSRDGK